MDFYDITEHPIIAAIVVAAIVVLYMLGKCFGGLYTVSMLYWGVVVLMAVLAVLYFVFKRKTPQHIVNQANRDLEDICQKFHKQRSELVNEYNAVANPIKQAFKDGGETDEEKYQSMLKALKPQFMEKEKPILDSCMSEQQDYILRLKKEHGITPGIISEKRWNWLLYLPIILAAAIFVYGVGATYHTDIAEEGKGWTAENLAMVHLEDKTKYVCNPDHVLSIKAVEEMDTTLSWLESDYGIESVVVVVNHIAGNDPFRLTQDIFERHGIGKDDRGLVIAVGYKDHSFFMATGNNLEGDLTDLECDRLQTDYFDPYAKAGQIDDAMTTLVDALYMFFSGKKLPPVADKDVSNFSEDEDTFWSLTCMMFILMVIWGVCICFLFLPLYDDRLKDLHAIGLLEGPWHNDQVKKKLAVSGLGASIANAMLSDHEDKSTSRSDDSYRSSSSRNSVSKGHFSGGRASGGGAGHRW